MKITELAVKRPVGVLIVLLTLFIAIYKAGNTSCC